MLKAIFFDLDNTLLQNAPFQFVRNYVEQLTAHLSATYPHVKPETIQDALRTAIRCVIVNEDPLTTNRQVFYEQFASLTGLDAEALQAPLQEFYAEIYPGLQSLTHLRPEAPRLVEWALAQGLAVAVATNPLFEATPVAIRLSWAGLDAFAEDFAFITSLDNAHFTKPHQMYYEEVLARVGVEPEETLMVGDDWQNDIVPAALCGLNTFWIAEPGQTPPPDSEVGADIQPDGRGSLADLHRQIVGKGWLETLQPRPLTVSQLEPRLTGNVAALIGLVKTVPNHFWNQRPDPQEWSPLEVVTHLRDSEVQVQRPRLQRILAEDNPFLSAPEPPPGPGQMAIDIPDGIQMALAFAAERRQTLDLLARLDAEEWKRPARHSVLGPTSLLEMVAFTARHDHLHITQLCQTLGKCE